jgi:predicted dehydrogenase
MTKKKLRTAVIGLGMGVGHLHGYRACPRAEMAAICDVNEERLHAVQKEFDIPLAFTSYEELLSRDDIDAVSVALPNFLHAPVSIAAAKAGKHVLCEKPMSTNAKDAQKMVDAATDAGVHLQIMFNNRFRGDIQLLKRYIADGELGDIYYAKCGWVRRMGIPGSKSFITKKTAGGGPMYDLGVHVLDMTMYLIGNVEPVSVMGSMYMKFGHKIWGKDYEVEDLAAAFIKCAGGETIMLETSWAQHCSQELIYASVYGTDGGADTAPLRIYTDKHGVQVDFSPRPPEINGHSANVAHFVDVILDGIPCMSPGTDGVRVQKVLDGIYKSAETGKAVKVNAKL